MPFIVPLLAAVGSAFGIGSGIAGLVSNHGPQAPPPISAGENIANETKNRMQQALLVHQQTPDIQSQTSGGVSPDYVNTLASQAAGVYGNNPQTTNPGAGAGFLGLSGAAEQPGGWQGALEGIQGLAA